MRFRTMTLLAGVGLWLAACSSQGGADYTSASLDTPDQKASYGIGLNVGRQIRETKDRLDRMAFLRGIEDALQGNEPAVPQAELQEILNQFAQEMQAAAAEDFERRAAENAEAGEQFLTENAAKEGVVTVESGLQYEVLREGDGPRPGPGDRVRIHYRGTLIDGTEFDSSYGGEPAEFDVGGVIPGFSEALQLMPVGSKFRVVIPSELAYGAQGTRGQIGPNETLIFEIELLEIMENEGGA